MHKSHLADIKNIKAKAQFNRVKKMRNNIVQEYLFLN